MPSVFEFILIFLALISAVVLVVIWRYYRSVPNAGSRGDPTRALFRSATPTHNRSMRR